ncbi:hypothetical protein MMU07_20200 [Aquiflexum sp. LQ15W]|uniref:hypothetical protein n=1 Tax=Cognataquiflexum nitidum TaxID=2922272 RepID=UPI001F142EB7|nr:hypothetical protein [Cognataquiflexum nitidum]MCH6201912.1 hypothetical protein [Cognataquiflexum nitidum]
MKAENQQLLLRDESIIPTDKVLEKALGEDIFSLYDILPIWVAASLPYVPVILLEIPIAELMKTFASFVL